MLSKLQTMILVAAVLSSHELLAGEATVQIKRLPPLGGTRPAQVFVDPLVKPVAATEPVYTLSIRPVSDSRDDSQVAANSRRSPVRIVPVQQGAPPLDEDQWQTTSQIAAPENAPPQDSEAAKPGDATSDALVEPTETGDAASDWVVEAIEAEEPASDKFNKPIGLLTASVAAPAGDFPKNLAPERALQDGSVAARGWADSIYQWQAPTLCHQPLLFAEVNLERYGYSHFSHLQPVVSGAHFFGSVLALPYNLTAQNPCECVYTLGHYRPGSWVPYRKQWPPASLKGAASQVGTVAGLLLLLP